MSDRHRPKPEYPVPILRGRFVLRRAFEIYAFSHNHIKIITSFSSLLSESHLLN